MDDKVIVSMDNLMGLLPENLAMQVDYLMKDYWDSNGRVAGHVVFTSLIHAYHDLGIDTKTSREWTQPDIQELLLNNRIAVNNYRNTGGQP